MNKPDRLSLRRATWVTVMVAVVLIAATALLLGKTLGTPRSAALAAPGDSTSMGTPAIILSTYQITVDATGRMTPSSVNVTGSGFIPKERVFCFFPGTKAGAQDIGLQLALANDYGAFEMVVALTNLVGDWKLAPGVYTLEAQGLQGSIATAPLKLAAVAPAK